jgi:succinyl-CoA synthetase beta subunit
VKLGVPLVVRMKGTNEDLGKKILKESGLPIISADTMAEAATAIVAAVKEVGLKIPVVVRLQGTNVDQGRELLANSGLAITPADDLNDAAQKAVAAAKA